MWLGKDFFEAPIVRSISYCCIFISCLYIYGGINRNTGKSVRKRLVSASVGCCIIFLDTLTFTRRPDADPWSLSSYDFSRLFIRRENLLLALLLPTLTTALLFMGTLWTEWRSRSYYTLRGYAEEVHFTLGFAWLRTVVIAPLIEEIIYRGCILFHLQRQFHSCGALCLGSGLLFAISHLHHVVEKLYDGLTLQEALAEVLPQVIMTAFFGTYSTIIVLRSGHLVAACAVHSLCNAIGPPDIPMEMYAAQLRNPQWGRRIYLGLLLTGCIGWALLIGPATTLFGLSQTPPICCLSP